MRSKAERDQRWHQKQRDKREKHEQRELRDQQATAWHKQAVAAGQTERMLVRAVNGELISYLPEEYGVARMSYGGSVSSVGGYGALAAGMLIVGLGVPVWGSIAAIARSESSPVALWILPLFCVPMAWYFIRSARREATAVCLRHERGLPAPTSQTIESKWNRDLSPNGA